MTYSFSYLVPVCCSMSSSHCCFLTWSGKQLREDTPCPSSGAAAIRRYRTSKVRSSVCASLEQPWIDIPLPRTGAGGCTSLNQPCGDTPCPSSEKPQKDGRHLSGVRRYPSLKAIASQIYLSRLLFVLDYGPANFFFFAC